MLAAFVRKAYGLSLEEAQAEVEGTAAAAGCKRVVKADLVNKLLA